ncbi:MULTISPECIES: DUF2867 domain-containing protein [unclassified Brenneria]|uniref:DUF2867 domain-containing protein n=1 Tax=unclassified Brenneria TaxID=2634434 RepID=UPI00155625B8|nr:DUF2867 domain-containing protein [Brenneria sp. hezel4-2-4]MEE3649627.1 DUF2867 domain-containing protein [Brenneria sp. HEZEL_4_2_4]NPC99585.1 DUF2867 domain-containing protein [Brenneria sp. hezel4-2-4]
MTSHPAPILILGASGYIGRHLTERFSRQGLPVIAAARRIDAINAQRWPGVTCRSVDLCKPETLTEGLWGAETLYYLVHSMGDGENFIAKERVAAMNLLLALPASRVKHIVYLGALQAKNDGSPHLQARKITGDILRGSGIPVTELRAGIIVGAGSAAFEIMRDMVYNLPVLTPPRWVRSKSSPIALENLLVYLTEIRLHPAPEHRIMDAAGPEYISYQTLFERFIAISGKRRLLIPVPMPTHLVSVWFLHLITSVPPTVARALIQGLKHDLQADGSALQALIPQTLLTFDQAVRTTLQSEMESTQSADWGNDTEVRARWKPDYGFYPKQAGHSVTTPASSQALWRVVQQIGGKEGYFYANALWKLRARLDDLSGNGVTYGRPDRPTLEIGDKIDGWKVISIKPQRQLVMLFGMKAPGLGKLTFTITDRGTQRTLDVRARWHPAGFNGLVYWFLMMPAHLFIFRGMAARIARLAEETA